jgi:hypothetical protein
MGQKECALSLWERGSQVNSSLGVIVESRELHFVDLWFSLLRLRVRYSGMAAILVQGHANATLLALIMLCWNKAVYATSDYSFNLIFIAFMFKIYFFSLGQYTLLLTC